MTVDGQPLRLTSAEAGLLSALAAVAGEVLSRDELTALCNIEGGERAIDVQVHGCGEKSNQIRAFPDICRRFADAVTYCGRTNHDGPAKPNDQTVFAEVSLRPVVNDNNYPAHFVAGRLDLDLLRPPLGHDYATAGELDRRRYRLDS